LLLIMTVPKDNMTRVVCNYVRGYELFARMCPDLNSSTEEGSEQTIASRVNLACIDAQGLRISIGFDQPLTGAAHIQVFSTGPDFFPSEMGRTDTYEIRQILAEEVDRLDFAIPVDAMPVGELIFGNMVVSGEGTVSHLAYLLEVSDCSTTGGTPANSQNDAPAIQGATCLASRQLMITFEFNRPVLGQYQALVDGKPYQLSSVVSQPVLLFFSGEPPAEGPVLIRLISAIDETTFLEETYTPPVCGGA
ncbi:MAG: hypothetical protein ACXW4E_05420, partial [Anaerolineales bacterium]